MQEEQTPKNMNVYFGIAQTLTAVIAVLMFYPMFGGTLLLLNGIFVYFSYFLATFLLVVYTFFDFILVLKVRKTKDAGCIKKEHLSFLFCTLFVILGLMQGRYVVAPILSVIYIVLAFTQVYQIAIDSGENIKYHKISFIDVLQRIVFLLAALSLLLGNQPFETYNLPLATIMLFLLVFINFLNLCSKTAK